MHWEALDDRSAKAALTDGTLSVTMLVEFDRAGLIASGRFEARGATVGNAIVQTAWEGRWSNYQERKGMRVPMTGEATWLPAQGRKPYWRGTVTSRAYEISP